MMLSSASTIFSRSRPTGSARRILGPAVPAFAAALFTCPFLMAQNQAAYTTYGQGCASSTNPCISANWNNPFSGNGGVRGNFALLFNTGTSTRVVCGVELFCKLVSSNPTPTNVSIWDRPGGGAPGQPIATAVMNVGGVAAAYSAIFSAPKILPPNTDYFVVFDNRVGLNMPTVTSGTIVTHYWNGPPRWSGPARSQRWTYRVLCCGSSTPLLSTKGLPRIGQSFSVDLGSNQSNALVFFATGLTKTSLDLTPAGAPGCTLLLQPLVVLGLRSDNVGAATVRFSLPNTQALMGFKFFNQFAVNDPSANAMQLAFTQAGEGTAGN